MNKRDKISNSLAVAQASMQPLLTALLREEEFEDWQVESLDEAIKGINNIKKIWHTV